MLSLLRPRLGTLMVFTALLTGFSGYTMAGKGKEEIDQSPPSLPQQPQFVPLEVPQQAELIRMAKEGDRDAQDQLIERNYWGFLSKNNLRGLWGDGGRGGRPLNPIHWENIEERAIDDSRYAYAVIGNYSHVVRWDRNAPNFNEAFPNLVSHILESAGEGDLCAIFNLGVLYHQFQSFPHRIGLEEPPASIRDVACKLIRNAATQGHSLAMSAMGLLSFKGLVTGGGRDEIEPLRWYLGSSENKISQDALRRHLRCRVKLLESKEPFQAEITGITERLQAVWGRHLMQVSTHNPEGRFVEATFAIPQLADRYRSIVKVEEEALEQLSALHESTPGLLMTGISIREIRDRERMLSRQTVPFTSITSYENVEYLTLGEKNVVLAARLMSYLEEIDERFTEATEALVKVRSYYETQLDLAMGELMKLRLIALAKRDADSAKSFEDQKRTLAELKELFSMPLSEIAEETEMLTEVCIRVKSIITDGVDKRNQDFLREHLYLI